MVAYYFDLINCLDIDTDLINKKNLTLKTSNYLKKTTDYE